MRRVLTALLIVAAIAAARAQPAADRDATPATIDEFRATAARVLDETGVPGAGFSLVRASGVEWEGGLGAADRDRRTPVTADTHFRVGSISKTFVAMALVQLSEDGVVDLEAPLAEVAPEIAIDNPWHDTDPVRVIHLLQHTAGFDDLHFTEIYRDGSPLPLGDVLAHNPASRRVRWRPGTRMAYSNPGYLLAGYLIETLTDTSFDTYIRDEILQPLGMTTSGFALTAETEQLLAMGYHNGGPPVGFPDIYMRPAGALHTSPREMSRFLGMLLNWGELDAAFIIDPEYLGNMEQPRTTIAARAGLRHGYGSGIFWSLDLPYPMLGHDGGIDGFLASYGYSPSRDIGYALMLNSDSAGAGEALTRLRSLCVRYLKRDVAPPVPPTTTVAAETLDRYVGYYHDANPRMQIAWGAGWLMAGRTVVRDGSALFEQPVFGARERLIAVSDTLFRRERDVAASRVFTLDDDDRMVLAGPSVYAQRRPRWDIERVRVPVLASLVLLASTLLAAPVWLLRARRARPHGFWALKATLVLLPLTIAVPAVLVVRADIAELGLVNAATSALWLGPLVLPILAVVALVLAAFAWRQDAGRLLLSYAALIVLAAFVVTVYLRASNLLGLRLWMY